MILYKTEFCLGFLFILKLLDDDVSLTYNLKTPKIVAHLASELT